MVIFHFGFLLRRWYGYDLPWIDSAVFGAAGGAAALLFFLVSGAATSLSYRRMRVAAAPPARIAARLARRSLHLWLAALLVTLVTSLAAPADTVWFGTLHFLAVGNFLLLPFLALLRPKALPPAALALMLLGFWLRSLQPSFSGAVWLGAAPVTFRSLDYYPLLPWLSALLCGCWLEQRFLAIKIKSPLPRWQWLEWLGRHSLWIYLLHLPLLLGGLAIWRNL